MVNRFIGDEKEISLLRGNEKLSEGNEAKLIYRYIKDTLTFLEVIEESH